MTVKPAAMAEWLRRWTRNPMGNARVGSNPTRSDYYFLFFTFLSFKSPTRITTRSVCLITYQELKLFLYVSDSV